MLDIFVGYPWEVDNLKHPEEEIDSTRLSKDVFASILCVRKTLNLLSARHLMQAISVEIYGALDSRSSGNVDSIPNMLASPADPY